MIITKGGKIWKDESGPKSQSSPSAQAVVTMINDQTSIIFLT